MHVQKWKSYKDGGGLSQKVTIRGSCLRWLVRFRQPPPSPLPNPSAYRHAPLPCSRAISRAGRRRGLLLNGPWGLHNAWMDRFSFSISFCGDTNTGHAETRLQQRLKNKQTNKTQPFWIPLRGLSSQRCSGDV